MNRIEARTFASWGPLGAVVALAALFFLGCANDTRVVDVEFTTAPADESDDTPPSPTPTATTTPGDDVPTPTPSPSPSPTASPDPTPGPTPSLSCGSVVIRDLRIHTSDAHGPSLSFRPWVELELADPDGSAVNGLGLQAGVYDRVRFTVHKPSGSGSGGPGTGDPGVNHSMHLCGTWNGIAWDYLDDTTFDVDRQDEGGVTVDGDGPAKLFVVFDSSIWFDGIDLSQAEVAPDGVVYLDHRTNHHLQDALRQNFVRSVHLANKVHE